jgi:hypothetical protein
MWQTHSVLVFIVIFYASKMKTNILVNFSVAAKNHQCYIPDKNNAAELHDHKGI